MKFYSKTLYCWIASALALAVFSSPTKAGGYCDCDCGPELCFSGNHCESCQLQPCFNGDAWVEEMIGLINDERDALELKPFFCNYIAMDHAQLLADFLCDNGCSEVGTNHNCAGQVVSDRLDVAKDDGLSWNEIRENLHDAPYLDPMLAMYGGTYGSNHITGFMESSGHRNNILSNVREVGLAYKQCASDGRTYWVQWFGM